MSPPGGWALGWGQGIPGLALGPPASSPGPCHCPLSWRPSSVLCREEPGRGAGGSEHLVSHNLTGKEWKSRGSHSIGETIQVLHPIILQISGMPVSACVCVCVCVCDGATPDGLQDSRMGDGWEGPQSGLRLGLLLGKVSSKGACHS